MWDDFGGGDFGDWGDIDLGGGWDFGSMDPFSGWDNTAMAGLGGGALPGAGGLDMQSFSQLPFNPSLMGVPGMQQSPGFQATGADMFTGQGQLGGAPTPPMGGPNGGFNVGAPGTAGLGAPGAQGLMPTQQNSGPLGALGSPQSILGLLGGGAGILGQLLGGGKGGSVTPQMSMEGRNAGTQTQTALGQLNPLAMGTSPLQSQQNALLTALGSGQGLPPGYAQLVEQAFQPQMGNIATQAIESARRRGFAGGAELLQQGPAGAIAGPALADLQGQMAQAKLGLLQSLPGLYNTPIANQSNAASNQASGYNNLMRSYPTGQTQSQPLGSAVGTALGAGLQGLGQSIGQQQQQASLDQLFRSMQGGALGQQQKQPPQPGGLSFSPTEY